MKTFDLTYITSGLFTRFVPNTTAGEEAWRVLAEESGNAAVFSIHASNVTAQLRKAGYSVGKAPKAKPVTASEIGKLLAELNA